MKMTFEVPDKIGKSFREAVPSGKRSQLVAQFMASKSREQENAVIKACQEANALKAVEQENREWEKFDDTDKA